MKIISRTNSLILSKKELTSKNDKTKKFYQVLFFIPETEETHKLFITKDKFDKYELNKLYAVELIFIIDNNNKISIYLQN